MQAPAFWSDPTSPWARLLTPLGYLYDGAGRVRRRLTAPQKLSAPVICVGNVVAGGAGKTPTALALADRLLAAGLGVRFLSRGHGGQERGPLRVDLANHDAAAVGDEPLLLAAKAPTWIAVDRRAGGLAVTSALSTPGVIVMDDGLQNPTLYQDLSLLVVDAGFLFGNGRVIPAGPLRERLDRALDRASAVVLIGEETETAFWIVAGMRPTLTARLVPDPASAAALCDRPVLAFAGIGRPQKFFDTLVGCGADVRATRIFPDHHPYSADDLRDLIQDADAADAVPITTAKDAVRLPRPGGLRDKVLVLPVTLSWDDRTALDAVLASVLPAPPLAPETTC